MEMRQIKYFIYLSRYGNFTRASEALHITQPTLSQQISALEDELGVRLFIRSKRKSILTPAGNAFLAEAQKLTDQYSRCFECITPFLKNESLYIGRIDYFEPPTFLRQVHSYMESAPGVAVHYNAHQYDELISLTANKVIDVSFLPASKFFRHENLSATRIGTDTISFIIPKYSRFSGITGIDDPEITRLLDLPCFFQKQWNFDNLVIDYIEKNTGKQIDPIYLDSASSIAVEVLSNNGFAICVASWFEKYAPPGKYEIVPLPEDMSVIDLLLIYAKDNANPCIQPFLQMALRTAPQLTRN